MKSEITSFTFIFIALLTSGKHCLDSPTSHFNIESTVLSNWYFVAIKAPSTNPFET